MTYPRTNKSLKRAIDLLVTLAGTPKTLTQLSEIITIQPSGALKILKTFMIHDLVRRLDDGRYTLGPKCCELAKSYLEQNPLPRIALPILLKYSQKSKMRYILAETNGMDQVNLLLVDSVMNRAETLPCKIGAAWPQATGQVLLAYSSENFVKKHLKEYPFLPGRIHISTVDELQLQFINIRDAGIAVVSPPDSGMSMVAAPIFDHIGQITASVGQSLSPHKSPAAGKKNVIAAAKEISALLGNS